MDPRLTISFDKAVSTSKVRRNQAFQGVLLSDSILGRNRSASPNCRVLAGTRVLIGQQAVVWLVGISSNLETG